MTINRLGKCKTLEDFKEFSKNVQTDMNSGGRSFMYMDPNGDLHSYSMNQIVRQFDKCIKKSMDDPARDISFYTEVNEGLGFIDQWNKEADGRENTLMLSFRKWLGNGWYSITHSGFDKGKTLEQIRNIKLPSIPSQVFGYMMKFQTSKESDRAAMSLVNKECSERAKAIEAKNDALIAEYGIFGRKQWQACRVETGNVPALPKGIRKIMESDCPFWKGKKVRETHRLVLIPKTVNEEPLTLNSIGQIAKNPRHDQAIEEIIARWFWDGLVGTNGDMPIDKSYWVLTAKDRIPKPFEKGYEDQRNLLTDTYLPNENFSVLFLLQEAAVVALTQYLEDGTRLFRRMGTEIFLNLGTTHRFSDQ